MLRDISCNQDDDLNAESGSDHCAFRQWTQYHHMGVSSTACEERVNTVPSHGGLMDRLWRKRWSLEISVEPSIPPVNTVPSHGGLMDRWWRKRWSLEISVEPSIPPVNTVPSHGGQFNSLWRKRQGLEISVEPSIPRWTQYQQVVDRWTACEEKWGLEISTELLSTQWNHLVVRSKDQKLVRKGGA